MKNKKKSGQISTGKPVVNRDPEIEKLTNKPWFWIVFVIFIVVIIGLVVLFAWLLSTQPSVKSEIN